MWNRTKNRDSNRCLNLGSEIFSIGGMAIVGVDLNRFLRLMCSGILARAALLSSRHCDCSDERRYFIAPSICGFACRLKRRGARKGFA
jgi:hypothetical protein